MQKRYKIKYQEKIRDKGERNRMKLETQTEQIISETVTVYGLSPQIGIHALAQTVNALAAQGAVFSVCPETTTETSAGVTVQIACPEYIFRSRIHKIEKLLKKACKNTI